MTLSIAEFEQTTNQYKEILNDILDDKSAFKVLEELLSEDDRAKISDYYALLRRLHDYADDKLTELRKVITHMEENILPDLLKDEDEFGMSTGYRTEKSPRLGYTVYIGTETYISMPDKPTAFNFLRANDYSSAIEETVHHKRLPSIYREINEKGIDIPEGLFKVTTKHKARLRNS